MLDLVSIKIGIIFGLLILTFIASCLPLLLILPFLGGNGDKIRSSSPGTSIWRNFQKLLPCLSRNRRRRGQLSTSTEFSEENENNDSDDDKKEENNGRKNKTTLFLDIMNCFSGGVFLGTSFLALIPEIREIFDEVGITWPKYSSSTPTANATSPTVPTDEESGVLMPVTEILVTCGMFMILCLEQIVHSILDRGKHFSKKHSRENSASEEAGNLVNSNFVGKVDIKVTTSSPMNETEVIFNDDDISVDVRDSSNHGDKLAVKKCESVESEHQNDSMVRSLILVFTLSMHSLMEGLAIGLQTQASSILSIFVAILFHKSLMAFSMGNNLVQSGQTVKAIIISAVILALASPSGITIGIIMKEKGNGTEIANGVLQAIATGTFLFITFFEVLSKEFSNHSNRVVKTLAFILGFCAILAVMFAQHAN